jgi:hypothetical protein
MLKLSYDSNYTIICIIIQHNKYILEDIYTQCYFKITLCYVIKFFHIQMYYVDRKKVEASLLTLIVKALLCPILNNI